MCLVIASAVGVTVLNYCDILFFSISFFSFFFFILLQIIRLTYDRIECLQNGT